MMKLDILGKMITGEDLDLMDKIDNPDSGHRKEMDMGLLMKAGFRIG